LKSQSIIISPSGNFYGSERTLFDFISNTTKKYTVYVPSKSILASKVQALSIHDYRYYSLKSIPFLYIQIILALLFSNTEAVYINEAGHAKYIRLLASLFPHINFIIHIRIIEDTNPKLLGKRNRKNIKYLINSNFLKKNVDKNIKTKVIYNLYPFVNKEMVRKSSPNKKLQIGIVGRIGKTKGLDKVLSFLQYLEKNIINPPFDIHFFGDSEKSEYTTNTICKIKDCKNINVTFEGFIGTKEDIYSQTDIIIHFSKVEAFGRIFLEAIDFDNLFIGFNYGGIAEIAQLLKLENYIIPSFDDDWCEKLFTLICELKDNYQLHRKEFNTAKLKAIELFSTERYVSEIENQIG